MRINTNVASLNAQANNAATNNQLTNSLEKLSSGLKINKAADDASGMAIADKLRMQASVVGQGIENANSGSALITIADKAMGEQSKILDTIKTKLLQAATSTTSAEGREAIRKDIQKLLNQIDAISQQTTYNGVNLLNKKGEDFSFQVGEKSTDVISMQTAYAVNTQGLGSSDREFANSATVYANDGGVIAGLALEGEAVDAKVNIKSTAGSIGVTFTSGASAVEISGTDVTAITTDTSVIITVTDTDDIAFLNQQVSLLTTDGFVKLADGVYAMTAGSGTFANGAAHDFKSFTVSGATAGGSLTLANATSSSIEKISGNADITINNAIQATVDGDTAEGVAFGDQMMLTEGTVAIAADAPATNGAVAINTVASTSSGNNGELDISIASEKVVKSISLYNTAGAASVILSTTDGETAAALEATGLTKSADGTFVWSTSTSSLANRLTFAGDGIEISNLTIEGVTKTTSGLDTIFVETTGAITVENLNEVTGNAEGINPELQNGVGIQVSTWDAGGATNASVATAFSASMVDSGLGASQLSGLLALGEGKLTSETASNFMSVIDDAMTQLNTVRSDFGSTQNQIRVAVENMMVTQVNLKAAESTIRDVDYAAESANFNKQNIISQAGTYALSQANQVQQNILRLLQ